MTYDNEVFARFELFFEKLAAAWQLCSGMFLLVTGDIASSISDF